MTTPPHLHPLLSKTQFTLAKPTDWLHGYTLRTYPASIRLVPAEENAGRSFRVFHQGKFLYNVPVGLNTGRVGLTWTDTVDPATGYSVAVVEHPGGAIVLAGLDNVIIEVNYPGAMPYTCFYGQNKCTSVPLLNGTAQPYLDAIAKAGLKPQKAPRKWFTVAEAFNFPVGESTFRFEPRTEPGWSVKLTMDMNNSWWRVPQEKQSNYDLALSGATEALAEIASARASNYTYIDWLKFRAVTIGRNRKADFVAFHSPLSSFTRKPMSGQPVYGNRETIDHRNFDLLGDTMFFAGYIQANITVHGGVHEDTGPLRTKIYNEERLIPLR
jgi:UDP-3-O-acyl-N-acetylglucosamine deacetylase